MGGNLVNERSRINVSIDNLLNTPTNRCPVCHTAFPTDGSRKAYCSHVVWRKKVKGFIVRREKRHDDIQEQKYAINPLWRRRR